MKKMYYSFNDDGSVEYSRHDGREGYLITISSTGDPIETATVEAGNTLGPYEMDQDECEYLRDLILENLKWFEEMAQEEAEEHLQGLSEEWRIPVEELSYLM